MVRQVLVSCLLLITVLVTCAVARPTTGCREVHSSSHTLERLIRRSAAIASRLSNLRSIRERRWSNSYPIWKSLHKTQERAMDISNLPPQPVPGGAKKARDFHEGRAAMEKDFNAGLGDVKELGFWHHEPFAFPELSKPSKDVNAVNNEDLKPETVEGWGPEEGWEQEEGWGPMDYDSWPAGETEDPFEAEWGDFVEPLDICSDDIVGNPCTRHSDCQGCRAFHCSSTKHCLAGPEPDPHFAGFV